MSDPAVSFTNNLTGMLNKRCIEVIPFNTKHSCVVPPPPRSVQRRHAPELRVWLCLSTHCLAHELFVLPGFSLISSSQKFGLLSQSKAIPVLPLGEERQVQSVKVDLRFIDRSFVSYTSLILVTKGKIHQSVVQLAAFKDLV